MQSNWAEFDISSDIKQVILETSLSSQPVHL